MRRTLPPERLGSTSLGLSESPGSRDNCVVYSKRCACATLMLAQTMIVWIDSMYQNRLSINLSLHRVILLL